MKNIGWYIKVQNNIIIIVSCKGHYVKERK